MPTWVRCRDRDTGHEYDLRVDDARVESGVVEVLADYPENSGPAARPRPAKHRITKAGRPARKAATRPAETNKEIDDGTA